MELIKHKTDKLEALFTLLILVGIKEEDLMTKSLTGQRPNSSVIHARESMDKDALNIVYSLCFNCFRTSCYIYISLTKPPFGL